MASFQTLPSGSTRAFIRRKGHPKQHETFKTEEEARAWADRTEAAMLLRTAQAATDGTLGPMTIKGVWDLYIQSPAFKNKATSTRSREEDASTAVLRLLGDTALSNIDVPVVQTSFIDQRSGEKTARGKPVSGDTVRLEKALLSALFSFSLKRGYCKNNPMAGTKYDMPNKGVRDVRITFEQEVALKQAAWDYLARARVNETLLFWLNFTFDTGSRPGESARIELSWVDFKKMEIAMPRRGQKTRNPRIVILDERLCEIIKPQYDQAKMLGSKYLFFSHTKKHGYAPYAYYHPWRAICKMAGLPPEAVPHSGRHEFISRLFEYTEMSDSQIAALVGDVNVLSLGPYKHLRVGKLRGKMDAHRDELRGLRKEAFEAMKSALGNLAP
jgi:integrase